MDIKSVQEALKLQAEFNARLAQSMDSLRSGKKLTLQAAVEEKRREVGSAGARVKTLEKERADAVSRLDQRLEHGKADLERLQVELTELESRLKGPGRGPGGGIVEPNVTRRQSAAGESPDRTKPGKDKQGKSSDKKKKKDK